uniref:40S ribosomal protein S27 n=1 Tax=Dicentrarchus labrax TaxID=13489 RepID=A0A8P4KLY6_DICLA
MYCVKIFFVFIYIFLKQQQQQSLCIFGHLIIKYINVFPVEEAGRGLDLTNMAATACQIRHVRLVLKGTTNMNPSLPVMPPFRQRLFPRQHATRKRLVASIPMDVKCPGCYKITTVFSHAQTVVLCVGCSTVLCQPTGGKARLTEGCSFRRKQH